MLVSYCVWSVTSGLPAPISALCALWATRVLCRGGHGSEKPELTTAKFCVFSDPDPESKTCGKLEPDPKSLSIFGSNRSLHGLCKSHC